MKSRIVGRASALVAVLLLSTSASAADPKAEAAARFDRGIHLFDEGDYAVALAEFRRAYDVSPHPIVLYNMALTYAALGDSVRATDACEALLKAPGSLGAAQLTRARAVRDEQASRVAELAITTSDAAHIEIDNVEMGVTPLAGPIRVSSGMHIVGAFATGFAPLRKQITVAGKTTEKLNFVLAPLEGRLAHLAITTRLPGAELVANGDVLGKTPLAAPVTLAPGKYHVELRREGYVTPTADIVLGDGANGSVTLDPEEDPARPASVNGVIELHASEEGATLLVDGKLRGSGAHLAIPAGPHHLRVERGGFFPFERDMVLEPGRTTPLDVHLQPNAETRAAYDASVRSRRTWGLLATGVGTALLAGGVVYVIVNGSVVTSAQSDYDGLVRDSERGSGRECDPAGAGDHAVCLAKLDAYSARLNDAKTRNTIGLVVAGVGLATAATGVILLVTGNDPRRYDRSTARAEPARLKLVPSASPLPGGGYVGLSGTF